MIGAWLFFVLGAQQPAGITVGDTVWVTARVPLGARQILRPQTWDLGEIGQALGPPVVDYTADSAIIRYPVAFWYPGVHDVVVPGAIVVNPEGRSDTLPGTRVRLSLLSVLPEGAGTDTLPPKPQATIVEQTERSLLPLGVLLSIALLGIGATRLLQRSRSRPRAVPAPIPVGEPDLPRLFDQWAEAGETRAALDGWAHLIERTEAASVTPDGSSEPIREALAALGFRPDPPPDDVDRVIRAAKTWLASRGVR